jgi:Tol biopolymer transport system component
MSPEQARGAAVDRRADVWAFGCVLFELLTGARAFAGETVTEVLAAILRSEPEWAALPAATPDAVRQLLERCLRKDPRQRLRDVGDARLVLDEALAGRGTEAARPAAARPAWYVHAAWAAAALALAAFGVWAGWRAREPPEGGQLRKLEVTLHNPLIDTWTRPRLSPDGRAIAYGASGRLWIRRLDRLEPQEVHGAEHGEAPFWSHDGRTLAFASRRRLWRVSADGGEPAAVCDLPATGRIIAGAWRPDDVIVFSAWQESVYTVPASGGDPRVLLAVDPRSETDFHELALLPDGRSLLLVPHIGTDDLSRIEVLRDGRRSVVLAAQRGTRFDNPRYSPTGHLVYERYGGNDGVWAASFSPDRLEVAGEPFRIMAGARNPGVARDGTLMYTLVRGTYQLGWVDRRGVRLAAVGAPQWGLMHPVISPDGTRVALSATDEGGIGRHDIWVLEITSGRRQRLDPMPNITSDLAPAWSADGRWVVFIQQNRVPTMAVVASAAQGGEVHDLAPGNGGISLSRDGRSLVLTRLGERTGLDLWYAHVTGDLWTATPAPLLRAAANEAGPRLSPDGRFLAYYTDETGQNEVYLRRFPEGDERWTVSGAGGSYPVWNGTGTELFYRALDGTIMGVPARLGASVSVGEPRALVDETTAGAETSRGWDVTPDGQRFLVVSRADEAGRSRVIVVQNWFAEFESRKPDAGSRQ